MAEAVDIVQAFMRTLGEGDFTTARRYLADDLVFQGPFDTFHRPEPYLESLEKLHHAIERVDVIKLFVDGDDVCQLYDIVTKTPAVTAFIAEWFQVRAGKISAIRVTFDARPFAAMFGT